MVLSSWPEVLFNAASAAVTGVSSHKRPSSFCKLQPKEPVLFHCMSEWPTREITSIFPQHQQLKLLPYPFITRTPPSLSIQPQSFPWHFVNYSRRWQHLQLKLSISKSRFTKLSSKLSLPTTYSENLKHSLHFFPNPQNSSVRSCVTETFICMPNIHMPLILITRSRLSLEAAMCPAEKLHLLASLQMQHPYV